MIAFDFLRPKNAVEALEASLERPLARYIAGGTNLLDLMKLGVEQPPHLIDIGAIGLRSIDETSEGGLRIGALVSNSELAAHPWVRSRYPVLSRAILAGASAQLRNKATTAGNLLQRTRCCYFYDLASSCNKRSPGTGCDARNGFGRSMAILGTSDQCIASHPSDMAVAMRALDVRVETALTTGAHVGYSLDELYRVPADTPHLETVLQPGELVTAIVLPPPPKGRHLYRKVRDRASYAFALVSVAAIVAVEEGRISSAALAFGGIGTIPWRNREAEQKLVGEVPSPGLFDQVADAVLAGARLSAGNGFKIPLFQRTLRACLLELTGTKA